MLVKQRTEQKTEGREGPATIPRPSFTNYAEYLLTGGLSLRLLSHPTPLIFPPFNIPSLSTLLCCSLPHAVERKLLTPPGKWRRQKKRRIRRKIRESLAQALIWKIFHSDKTDDEKVIRVKVRSWASYLLLSCRNSSIRILDFFWEPVGESLPLPK